MAGGPAWDMIRPGFLLRRQVVVEDEIRGGCI